MHTIRELEILNAKRVKLGAFHLVVCHAFAVLDHGKVVWSQDVDPRRKWAGLSDMLGLVLRQSLLHSLFGPLL